MCTLHVVNTTSANIAALLTISTIVEMLMF